MLGRLCKLGPLWLVSMAGLQLLILLHGTLGRSGITIQSSARCH